MVDNVLIMVVDCDSSLEHWKKLAEMFMSQSKACYMPLKMQIQTTKKGALSVGDYFNKMKKIADSLAIDGNPLASTDFIMHLLTGLDENYDSLITNILARLEKDNVPVEEVYSLMLSHQSRIEMTKGKMQSEILHDMSANFAQKGQNYNKKGFNGGNVGGFDNSKNGAWTDKEVICQICFFPGHGAYKCRNKFNQNFIPRQGRGGFRHRCGFNYKKFSTVFSENSYGRGFSARGYLRPNAQLFQGNVTYQNVGFITPQGYPFHPGSLGHFNGFPGGINN